MNHIACMLLQARQEFMRVHQLEACRIYPSAWSLLGKATASSLAWEESAELFTFDGMPAVVVSHPFVLWTPMLHALTHFCDEHPILIANVVGQSFRIFGHAAVSVWRGDLFGRIREIAEERQAAEDRQPPRRASLLALQPWSFFQPELRKPGVN